MASHFSFNIGKRYWIVESKWESTIWNTTKTYWRGNWHIYLSPRGVNEVLRGQSIVTIYSVDATQVHGDTHLVPIYIGPAQDFPGLDKEGNLNPPCESTNNSTSASVATGKPATP